MPIKRIYINCAHYWIFFGLFNAIELYLFPSGHTYSKPVIYILFALWVVFEFCNYQCHLILASLRKTKEKSDETVLAKKRCITYGWGFNKISCANYFW